MKKNIFIPADVLLPEGISMETWSVIACDQFSSEREYWELVREKVDGMPSTLNMIIPEAYLEDVDEETEVGKIAAAMDSYIERGLFRKIEESFIYIERTQSDGFVRRGIVGAVDLEEYDFTGSNAAVLASEGTVFERLPARIRVRRAAKLELPHIMAFIDDKNDTVIKPLSEKTDKLPLLYDFDLMEGGGHIRGMQVCGKEADMVMSAFRDLHEKSRELMVIGDGNHSLAAAKVYWDELKQDLSESGRKTHPARWALIEVNNVYDPAINFEAIHRVVFDVDPSGFAAALENAMKKGNDYMLRVHSQTQSGILGVSADCIGDMLAALQSFLDEYISVVGGSVDYIHGADAVERLANSRKCVGIILPAMDKSELFGTVKTKGVFPKKSFSVGHSRDKRYYLECRAIGY